MFKCGISGKVSTMGRKVVVQYRMTSHHNKKMGFDEQLGDDLVSKIPAGKGLQISKEVLVGEEMWAEYELSKIGASSMTPGEYFSHLLRIPHIIQEDGLEFSAAVDHAAAPEQS